MTARSLYDIVLNDYRVNQLSADTIKALQTARRMWDAYKDATHLQNVTNPGYEAIAKALVGDDSALRK